MNQEDTETRQLHRHPDEDRLPPPAFPPGNRRDWVHRPRVSSSAREEEGTDGTIPDEAFHDPQDPIRRIDPLESPVGDRHEHRPDPLQVSATELTYDDVADMLEKLAREVRGHQGGRFLWKAGVTPLEGALRGLLSGYLKLGRREGERS